MRILRIEKGTIVDGPGFRTSIYIAGCRHQCPGCHNPSSWDFNAGEEMSLDELMNIIKEEEFDVTLTGGDPLYHPEEVTELTALIKEAGYSTWIYTGFTIEEIMSDPTLLNVIKNCEAIVEGRFIEKLRDPDLLFRGSSNQRIIYTSALF
ncbi:MAG: anaerobic ribonucleoside-triphosphate reductase activating protein [Bacteroidales bacterium]|nr:anaerobic ribonucleoside-triphosphate reductase activating protein [Bacteroidales bacterium]MBD5223670.1 anaerobic ribonucleoside-triphosphate reductase activating protein [Bacteroidales bacterium]